MGNRREEQTKKKSAWARTEREYLSRSQLECLHRLWRGKQLHLFHNEHLPVAVESFMQVALICVK